MPCTEGAPPAGGHDHLDQAAPGVHPDGDGDALVGHGGAALLARVGANSGTTLSNWVSVRSTAGSRDADAADGPAGQPMDGLMGRQLIEEDLRVGDGHR